MVQRLPRALARLDHARLNVFTPKADGSTRNLVPADRFALVELAVDSNEIAYGKRARARLDELPALAARPRIPIRENVLKEFFVAHFEILTLIND